LEREELLTQDVLEIQLLRTLLLLVAVTGKMVVGLVREVAVLGAGETISELLVEVVELLDKVLMEQEPHPRQQTREVAVVAQRERGPVIAVITLD
tara:strand:+ start:297 stop:581 length:285 start_codon:yes stop_codon:yes gene_type:complete